MKFPKVESLIITIFFLSIALWAISKCSSKRSQLPEEMRNLTESPEGETDPGIENDQASEEGLPKLQNPPPKPVEKTTEAAPAPVENSTPPGTIPKLSNEPPPATTTSPATTAAAPASILYVTIDGLKMRKSPDLKAPVVTRLKLDEQIYFLNEKSEKPQEINLGYETVTEYWVKVKTKSGKEGWVFGAGVHYFKMKRKGVMEK